MNTYFGATLPLKPIINYTAGEILLPEKYSCITLAAINHTIRLQEEYGYKCIKINITA